MATLLLRRPGLPDLALELNPSYTVLNQLSMAGVPIPHDCGGKARCGTCRLRIISGAEGLVPRTPGKAEGERLAAVGATGAEGGRGERLACQIRSARDLEVEISGRTAPAGG